MKMNIDPIRPGDRVLCAVSGGADSMYLLCRMLELAPQRGVFGIARIRRRVGEGVAEMHGPVELHVILLRRV